MQMMNQISHRGSSHLSFLSPSPLSIFVLSWTTLLFRLVIMKKEKQSLESQGGTRSIHILMGEINIQDQFPGILKD